MYVFQSWLRDKTFTATLFLAFVSWQRLSNNSAFTRWNMSNVFIQFNLAIQHLFFAPGSPIEIIPWASYFTSCAVKDAPQGSVLVAFSLAAPIISDCDSQMPPEPCRAPIVVVASCRRYRFISSRWYASHFNTTTLRLNARPIPLATLQSLHPNLFWARTWIEGALCHWMITFHDCCLQSLLHLGRPQSLSNCFQNPLRQNSEKVPILKSSYLSHRNCNLQTSHWTSIPISVMVHIDRSQNISISVWIH
jgi:hypothetical protein